MKVSWQVTGIRKDPWANANRIQVEEDKPGKEQGYYPYISYLGNISFLINAKKSNQECNLKLKHSLI